MRTGGAVAVVGNGEPPTVSGPRAAQRRDGITKRSRGDLVKQTRVVMEMSHAASGDRPAVRGPDGLRTRWTRRGGMKTARSPTAGVTSLVGRISCRRRLFGVDCRGRPRLGAMVALRTERTTDMSRFSKLALAVTLTVAFFAPGVPGAAAGVPSTRGPVRHAEGDQAGLLRQRSLCRRHLRFGQHRRP